MNRIIHIALALAGMIQSALTANAEFIREDRIWHYGMAGLYARCQFQMKFTGTKVIDGTVYHIFKSIGGIGYRFDRSLSDFDYSNPVTIDESADEYYMREDENGIVYIYDPSYGSAWFVEERDEDCKESVIYNFNLPEGESYQHIGVEGFEWIMTPESIEMIETPAGIKKHVTYQSVWRDTELSGRPYWYLGPLEAIEGVGFINRGTCAAFFNDCIYADTWDDTSFAGMPVPQYRDLRLYGVTDLDGNTVYDNGELGNVENITAVTLSDTDQRIFDMMGREVKAPQPGGVYIRAGRKFVGK